MVHLSLQALAVALCALLVIPPPASALDAAIQIRVLAGEGGINNINQNVAAEPIIEVVDATGKPVAKAAVTLRSPASGPSVTFFGASRVATVTTDDQGRVRVSGMLPNTIEGTFQIDVEAEYNSSTATATITQSNAVAPGDVRPKRQGIGWRVIAAISAGAAVGIVAAALRSGADPQVTPTAISIGSVSVSGPR
ncbi:MAG: carboxypeptidase regulatory-like domain-containing protein [Acidobacteriia bacterium]|nr:carboxypeptidase regulatory-like domain-containing protein [Terriglobia bacterium]MYG02613.1 carboxypeptidase regulatory-like domain-containing protein [Terriglobia bacterium]MYK10163.1 carboxypeptidase regulatory-like domain-containing protein [Terriglobia bacterium]